MKKLSVRDGVKLRKLADKFEEAFGHEDRTEQVAVAKRMRAIRSGAVRAALKVMNAGGSARNAFYKTRPYMMTTRPAYMTMKAYRSAESAGWSLFDHYAERVRKDMEHVERIDELDLIRNDDVAIRLARKAGLHVMDDGLVLDQAVGESNHGWVLKRFKDREVATNLLSHAGRCGLDTTWNGLLKNVGPRMENWWSIEVGGPVRMVRLFLQNQPKEGLPARKL